MPEPAEIQPNKKCVSCRCRWFVYDSEEQHHFTCLLSNTVIDGFLQQLGACSCYVPLGQ